MGDIAEGILNGDFDEVSGEYIGEGQGFPRSFHRSNSKIYEDKRSQRIVAHFPALRTQLLDGGGLNVKIPMGGTLTVWWNKGKWVNSKKSSRWVYFRDYHNAVEEFIAIVEGLVVQSAPDSVKSATTVKIIDTNGSVQRCIDHLLAKAETIFKNGGKAELSTLLKTTAKELTQYL